MQDLNRYKICTEKADWRGICDINGINFDSFGTSKELAALPSYLEPGEIVFALASGIMRQTITSNTFDGGLNTWLVALTSERFLFMDAAMMTSSIDTQSVRLNKVQAISASQGLVFGKISIDLGSRLITVDNCIKESVKVMADLANKWLKDLEEGFEKPKENLDMAEFKKTVDNAANQVRPPIAEGSPVNKNAALLITGMFGWSGLNDFIWGNWICGWIKLAINFLSVKLGNGEHDVLTALLAVVLVGWVFVDIVRISDNSFFKKDNVSVGSKGLEGFIGLAYLVLLVFCLIFTGMEFSDSRKVDNGKLASVREIIDSYNQNGAYAEKAFDGPRFTIAGQVKSVDKGLLDGYVIKFEGVGINIFNLDSKITDMEISFPKKQQADLMKIRKGDLIAASCIGRGVTFNLYSADKCVLKYVKKPRK